MQFHQAALIGLVYFFANSSLLFSMGLYTTARPLVLGMIVGLILGDIKTGIEMGIKIQLIFMGYITAGGSQHTDPVIAGLAGTAFAITFLPTLGPSALDAGLTIAVAFGAIGNLVKTGRMTLNTIFVQPAKRAIENGNLNGLLVWHFLIPQCVVFIVTALPLTLFLMSLGNSILIKMISEVVSNTSIPLMVIGTLLPTVGIATTLYAISKKTTIPFFIMGFILSQYLNLDIVAISIIGVIVAYLIYFGFDDIKFGKNKSEVIDT